MAVGWCADGMSPGETLPSVNQLVAKGDVAFSVQLSPSVAIFTLRPCSRNFDSVNACDVILRRQDGWSSDELSRAASELEKRQSEVVVRGYPEMMRAKFKDDIPAVCIHAVEIVIGNQRFRTTKQEQMKPRPCAHAIVPKRKKRGTNNGNRFAKFMQFLVDTFGGYEGLSRGILDVAGGAGGLAFEISVRHGIPCTVIDSRAVKFTKKQANAIAFRERCCKLISPGLSISMLARNMHNRFQCTSFDQVQELLDAADVLASKEKSEKMKTFDAIVGLHPDQATDHIIKVGLRLSIPWAVVPCCVFPNKIVRHLKTGERVRTYEDLCAWILEQDENVKEATLDGVEGRNRVFYMLSEKKN